MFQKMYDFLKNLRLPKWLSLFLGYIQEHVIIPTLKELGEAALNDLRRQIMYASTKSDWTNEKKFSYVVTEFKREWGSPNNIKDRTVNLIIEHTVSEMKEKGLIN